MFKNIADLRTTIPSLVGAVLSLLGVFGFIEIEAIPVLNDALVGLGFAILTLVGLFSKAE